jgi:hypothetical protein
MVYDYDLWFKTFLLRLVAGRSRDADELLMFIFCKYWRNVIGNKMQGEVSG